VPIQEFLRGLISVTETLYHISRKIRGKGTSHEFLVDIGREIEIHGVSEGEPLRGGLIFADPFHQKTQYFEIIIDVPEGDPEGTVENITVCPVRARKKPDLRICGVRVLNGRWLITERPESTRYGIPTVQWIYTDDFSLLHVASGNNDVDAMIELVTTRIGEIASSIQEGNRIRSHRENEADYRSSMNALLRSPLNTDASAIRKLHGGLPKDVPLPASPGKGTGITAATIALPEGAMVNFKLTEIDEINDMSWLFE
jgi:hypothetical protein